MGPMMPMAMFFYWSTKCWILFKEWHTTENDEMLFAFSTIVIFVICILHQWLLSVRKRLVSSTLKKD